MPMVTEQPGTTLSIYNPGLLRRLCQSCPSVEHTGGHCPGDTAQGTPSPVPQGPQLAFLWLPHF